MNNAECKDANAAALFDHAVRTLEEAKIADARSDAALLFEKATGLDRTGRILLNDRQVSLRSAEILEDFLKKRTGGMPVQYITGEAWFYGYRFHVEPGVLIPRFDTESLAEEALKEIRPGMKVLDLCTGSGCLIITLSKEAEIEGYGSDISDKALRIAAGNSERLEAGCGFIKSDLFENIDDKYDLIVSNPPYIRTDVIDTLDTEVKDHEPRTALDGGADGLEFYKKIIPEARRYLKKDGSLMFEIGFDQANDVMEILKDHGFSGRRVVKDLSGNDRVIRANV